MSSRLTKGRPVDLGAAVAVARAHGVPAIIDGAAQDFRMRELLATGADLVIVSAQKYLAAPTAGIVVGRKDLVAAVRGHEKGIGRAMKASKEAIAGVLAALSERRGMDEAVWRSEQDAKIEAFVARANTLPGIRARAEPDPTGLPFSRAHLAIDPAFTSLTATEITTALRASPTPIWVMDHLAPIGEIVLELVQVGDDEIDAILARLAQLLAGVHATSRS